MFTGEPETCTVSLTAAVVLLIRTLNEPLNVRPETLRATVALPSPARPLAVIMKAPDPLVMLRRLGFTAPKWKLTPEAATVTTFWSEFVVRFSNKKLPVKVVPRTVNWAPVALICKYGPAGRAGTLIVMPLTTTLRAPIEELVLFSRTAKVPVRFNPGIERAALALAQPEMPVGV